MPPHGQPSSPTRRFATSLLRLAGCDHARGAWQHQPWAASHAGQLPGRAPVNQPANRAVAARANDEQVERRAVQREFLGGVAVGGVGPDAAQRRDPLPGSFHQCVDGVAQAEQARLEPAGRKRDGLEYREPRAGSGRHSPSELERALARGRAVVADADFAHGDRLTRMPVGSIAIAHGAASSAACVSSLSRTRPTSPRRDDPRASRSAPISSQSSCSPRPAGPETC